MSSFARSGAERSDSFCTHSTFVTIAPHRPRSRISSVALRCDGGMADSENEAGATAALLPGAHRVVRTLDAKEGPFAGVLVTSGEGVCVRVDATALGGWVGWRFAGAEHVAAPIDVCRRRGGYEVLLPWCTDRVLGYLVRRAAGERALSAGECSTLVISLLRGLDELGEGAEGVRTGVWWLTDGGRPVFVLGDGPDARGGVIEILQSVQEHNLEKVVRRAVGAIEEGLKKTIAQPRLPRRLMEEWEAGLLDVAAPQPLQRAHHAPERARDVARAIAPSDRGSATTSQRLRADRARGHDTGRLVRGVVAVEALQAAVAALTGHLQRVRDRLPRMLPRTRADDGAQSRVRSRRRSLMVAGGVAVAVLVGGLLWPGGDDVGTASDAAGALTAEESAHSTVAAPAAPSSGDANASVDAPQGESDTGRSREDDPTTAAVSLVTTIVACHARDDTSCPEVVAAGAVGVVDALAAAGARTPTAELVDEYGDVSVVRLRIGEAAADGDHENGAAPVQLMVVLIRVDDKWLVRDVYDVADQPG